ncbi:DUF5959 family protein [Streptomyces sp. NPDC020965]|uniref:DUF5959 family protein n=1 Tax=Streptomyces sp. NPDC020965 TaxID=3365105 RepID=UPI003788C23B
MFHRKVASGVPPRNQPRAKDGKGDHIGAQFLHHGGRRLPVGGDVMEDGGVDLIHMRSAGSGVRLRVLGRHKSGKTPYHDYLDAAIVITSGFANGRLELLLSPEDMDDWSATLEELAAGRDVIWLRNTEMRIEIDRQFSVPVPIVTVTDEEDSSSAVRVWLDVGHGWVDDLRQRYARVQRTWPREMVTSTRSRSFWQ